MSRTRWRGLSAVSRRLINHLNLLQQRPLRSRVCGGSGSPSLTIRPDVGGSSPVMQRASVDFPDPDSPTTANVRPRCNSMETSVSTSTPP